MKSSPFSIAATAPRCRKAGDARGVDLHQLGELVAERRRMGQPADAPAGHRPGLGEAVEHEQRIVGPACSRKDGATLRVVDQAGINLVGHDPEAALAGEIEQRALLVGGHHPASRIARRVDEDRAGPRVDRVEQALHIELPATVGLRSSATYFGSARTSFTAELMLGQIGETMTTLSPGSSSSWQRAGSPACRRRDRDALDRTWMPYSRRYRPRSPRAARECRAARCRRSRRGRPLAAASRTKRVSPGRPRRTTAERRRDRRTPSSRLP